MYGNTYAEGHISKAAAYAGCLANLGVALFTSQRPKQLHSMSFYFRIAMRKCNAQIACCYGAGLAACNAQYIPPFSIWLGLVFDLKMNTPSCAIAQVHTVRTPAT